MEKPKLTSITIRMPTESVRRLQKLMREHFYGMQQPLFQLILEDLLAYMEEDIEKVMKTVALRTLTLSDFSGIVEKRKDKKDG